MYCYQKSIENIIKLQKQNKEIVKVLRFHKKKALDLYEDVKKLQESIEKAKVLLTDLQEKQKSQEELKDEQQKCQLQMQEVYETIEKQQNENLEEDLLKVTESNKIIEDKLASLQLEIDAKTKEITQKSQENKKLAEKLAENTSKAQFEPSASDESFNQIVDQIGKKSGLETNESYSASEEYQTKIEEMMGKLKSIDEELLKM